MGTFQGLFLITLMCKFKKFEFPGKFPSLDPRIKSVHAKDRKSHIQIGWLTITIPPPKKKRGKKRIKSFDVF